MALVHMLKTKLKTFRDLLNAYMLQLTKLFESGVQCVDVVFDIYGRGDSIKGTEAERRQGGVMGHEVKIHSPHTHVPQGKEFDLYIKKHKKKVHLTKFLGEGLVSKAKEELEPGKMLLVSYGGDDGRIVTVVRNRKEAILNTLASNQDEADPCLLVSQNLDNH